MNLFIRTDASVYIGTGHVVRCLTLADEITSRGGNIQFICREEEGNLIGLIERKGYGLHRLPRGIGLAEDRELTKEILENQSDCPDWLIVDHYDIDILWEAPQREFVRRIMVFDELANREHDADILLDQQYSTEKTRYNRLIPEKCIQLLGPEFAVLKSQFRLAREKLRERSGAIKRIMVSMGGTDKKNATSLVLKAFYKMNHFGFDIDVVIGPTCKHRLDIAQVTSHIPNTNLHFNVENMADLMAACDLAIGDAGNTTWERCCLGLPTLMVITSENQRTVAEELSKGDFITYVGCYEDTKEDDIVEKITYLINNSKAVKEISGRVKGLVDGNGTKRVVNSLYRCSN